MICKFIFFRNQSSLITMREKELTIRPTDQPPPQYNNGYKLSFSWGKFAAIIDYYIFKVFRFLRESSR